MSQETADLELIKQTVQYYFDGLYQSDVEKLKKAFHPNSQVIGHFQGTLLFNTLDQFLDFVSTFVFLLVDKANSIFFNQFLTRFLEWVGNEGEVSFLNICGKKNLRDDFVREHLLETKEVNQVSISFI